MFCYQHNLHSSQTGITAAGAFFEFCYQHNLHSSQTGKRWSLIQDSFATSIIYIVLKQRVLMIILEYVLLPA